MNIFGKSFIGKLVGGILLAIASWFHPVKAPVLGSFNPAQTQVFYLSGGGINSSVTSTLLTGMKYSNGTLVTMSDLGSIGFATIDPGFPNKEEQISFTNIIQNSDGTALLTRVIRGLAFNPGTQGCSGSSTLSVSHSGAAQLVLSNTACFYQQFAILSNTSTITGLYTFPSSSPATYNATPSFTAGSNQIPTVAYVNSVASSGAPDAGFGVKGLVGITTPLGATTSTDGSSVLYNVISKQFYSASSTATTTVPITGPGGNIDPSFYQGNANTWSALQTFNATATHNANITWKGLTLGTTTLTYTALLDSTGTQVTVGNTITTSTVYSFFVPTSTLNVGAPNVPNSMLRITLNGTWINNSGASARFLWNLVYGTSTPSNVTSSVQSSGSQNHPFVFEAYLSDNSATNAQVFSGIMQGIAGTSTASTVLTTDSTKGQILHIDVAPDTQASTISLTITSVTTELVGATTTVATLK